ncbi:MAG: hypothetical protein PF489_00235 [Salinivirgaceae bacterium]|jgi:hypothetical protein|nr:hypothetical protein [Salinivirgaceae bacterium]
MKDKYSITFKKVFIQILFTFVFLFFSTNLLKAQSKSNDLGYWNTKIPLVSYRLPPPPPGYKVEYIDLDNDGDPDVLRSITRNGIPVQWIDDDDDMKIGDLEGDTDNDCLMIDRNRDGHYGSYEDFIVDWVSIDGKKADLQVFVENDAADNLLKPWSGGHYMWMIDTDGDNIFNYIDWDSFNLKAWMHNGVADFFKDYHGKSAFMKMHSAPAKFNDLRLNWENPFLFYDPDKDGLSEMAIRLCDSPKSVAGTKDPKEITMFDGTIDWVSIAIDMDNDNNVGREFDFDFTLSFRGKGFDYMDQVHPFKNLRGLPEADQYFIDPRWRQITELIYPNHDAAWDLIYNRGEWKEVYFVWDEDDDCLRWERVELYEPRNPFKIGQDKGGVDNHRQSDAAGDRGEWDTDNSGKGNLYISPIDGKIHLYGAEWGCWRIDQNAGSFQGMGGIYENYGPGRTQKEPNSFATIKYTDTDNNGFFDQMEYDLNGDTIFEHSVSLKSIGIDDKCQVINTSGMKYGDFVKLKRKMAKNQWQNALQAIAIAKAANLNISWYANMMSPKSVRELSNYGYWLQQYIYRDLMDMAVRTNNTTYMEKLDKAYFSGNWPLLGKIKP